MLKPANITPIKLPHVYIELPNIGISNLPTANSKDIVTAPAIRTSAVKLIRNLLAGTKSRQDRHFKTNIALLHDSLCCK